MSRILTTVLITVIIILTGVCAVLWYKYSRATAIPPEKIEILRNELTGAGRLILAEQRVYQEYVKEFKKDLKVTDVRAKVLFRWMTNFQYLIDLQNPQFKITKEGNILKVNCPAIQLNEPAIDITTYWPGIVINGSLWINEQQLINSEMTEFKAKSLAAGNMLIKDPQVIKLCNDQVKLTVLKIVSGLQMKVDDVVVTFNVQ